MSQSYSLADTFLTVWRGVYLRTNINIRLLLTAVNVLKTNYPSRLLKSEIL